MKNLVFLSIGVILFFAGAAVIAYVFLNDTEETNNYTPSSQTESYPANNSANTRQSTSTLQVQGANSSEQQQQQSQLPLPNSFDVYEEFAASESTRYIDIVPGIGATATRGSTVAMLYQGWLTNGQLFDESRKNEQGLLEPFIFELGGGRVIQGWDQGIEGMQEGGKRRLIIPSNLAYGPNGQGPIPADAMLIFDVELLKVQ